MFLLVGDSGIEPVTPEASLANLRDPAAILDNLTRIQRAITSDPAQAVGSAKELIESKRPRSPTR